VFPERWALKQSELSRHHRPADEPSRRGLPRNPLRTPAAAAQVRRSWVIARTRPAAGKSADIHSAVR